MRILMTADSIGGVWQYALELCEALRAYDASVMLATLGAQLTPNQRRQVAELKHVELCESRYRLEWMPEPWDSLKAAGRWLLGLEQKFAPDLIHLNHLMHGNLPWHAPVISVGHSCVLSWWAAVRGDEPVGWSRYQREVARSLRAASLVCAPTRTMLHALQSHYGPLPRSRVIANGRDPNKFRARDKQPCILAAGRVWDAAKNIGSLCAIASEVDWPIYVAGATTGPNGETQAVDGVHPLGPLSSDALAEFYSKASIYALPARYEPFGLTVLEAALSRCALVLGDIDSLREVWGDAAQYVPPNDPAALRDALNALCRNPDRVQRLASLAHARAQRYSVQRFAAGYWNAYQSLLPSKEPSTCDLSFSITH
jgi:glycogen(starch) synthase